MNSILGICAYAPTNHRISCLFFIHESWLFCVCHITLDYLYYHLPLYDQQFTPYLIIVMVMYLVNIFTHYSHPLGKYK